MACSIGFRFERAEPAGQLHRDQVARLHAVLLDEALLAHPLVVEHLAEIPRAVVVEDHHDHIVIGEVIAELEQAAIADPAVSGEDAFSREIRRHHRRVLVGHLLERVDHVEVTFFGRKSSPIPSVM
jgi:hypothetical protein